MTNIGLWSSFLCHPI